MMEELIEQLKSDDKLKNELMEKLGIKIAKELPEDSKLKTAKSEELLEYIATLRKELEGKNEKKKALEADFEGKYNELKTLLDRQEEEKKLAIENQLKDEKRYKELLDIKEKELGELKAKYTSAYDKLQGYELTEKQEREVLLSKLNDEEREVYADANIKQLKLYLSRIEKNPSSPQNKLNEYSNLSIKSLDDLSKLDATSQMMWMEKNPALYEQFAKEDALRKY